MAVLGASGNRGSILAEKDKKIETLTRTVKEQETHTSDGAHLNTLGAVPLTLPPVPVWALAGTLR